MGDSIQRDGLIGAHGGLLINRYAVGDQERLLREQIDGLAEVALTRRELADLLLIAEGALSPLKGFQGAAAVAHVARHGRLDTGLAWTLPITLQAKGSTAKVSEQVVLRDPTGEARGILSVSERFELDLELIAKQVYGTRDPEHPGVAVLLGEDPQRLAGQVMVFPAARADRRRLSPGEVRSEISSRGWRDVAAFQTRNPLHRSHEYLLRIALEVSDGLLLHPLVGETKAGDIPAEVRMRCYEALIDGYLPAKRVLLSVLDTAMRYAGPAEAIHHAILRQNYGASRFIVGRDHAGVGGYYGPFDAQARFDVYEPQELAIRPLKLDIAFWCQRCGGIASPRTCSHDASERLSLSGSEVRRRLGSGEPLPESITRPEVAAILRTHYGPMESRTTPLREVQPKAA